MSAGERPDTPTSDDEDDDRPVLVTPRLCVLATPLRAAAASAARDRAALADAVGAAVAHDWPPPLTAAEKPSLRDAIRAHDDAPGFWGGFLVVYAPPHEGEPLLIGSVTLAGLPDLDGALSLGYSLVPSQQGRGFATEAARAVIAWAFFHSDARAITAITTDANAASQRVLARCGFTLRGPGPIPETRCYALTREAWGQLASDGR